MTAVSARPDLRVLSVRRPWANLIVAGRKTVENRSWSTAYRGRLVIHAGRTWVPAAAELSRTLGITGFDAANGSPGGFLGTVEVLDVHPAASCCAPWGFQDPDTFHWVLGGAQPFDEPIPGLGRLGLYRAPDHLLDVVLGTTLPGAAGRKGA
ncbi:ASCH domain-containing protein [Nocardia sp. GCM10030253]|uniref:ASCH domain-containing protein n=1 Tax=Nocardia sp. GCM10030253 TaxID=3273404 RepID=UPI003640EACC